MVRLLRGSGMMLGIWLGMCRFVAAQTAGVIVHSEPGGNGNAPRVLHFDTNQPNAEGENNRQQPGGVAAAAAAAEAGMLSPYALPAQVVTGRSWSRAAGGYDAAGQSYRAHASAESGLTSFMALRVDYEHGPSTSTLNRVSLGTRFQLLAQKRHGLDVGLALAYQPTNFRGEGTILGGLLLGRRFDRIALFCSAMLGSDPEGDDQELDGRIGALFRVSQLLQVGWDNRFRSVVTVDAKRFGKDSVDWELALLPNAIVTVGPVAFLGQAGFSALQLTERVGQPEQKRNLRTGLLAMAGAAAVF